MKLIDRLLEMMNSKKKIGCGDLVEIYRKTFCVDRFTTENTEHTEKQQTAFSGKEHR